MKQYAVLIGRIRKLMEDLGQVVQRAEALAKKAQRTGDDAYIDGVALNIHSFYTGVEHIFEDIARTVDGEVPSGGDWHRRLLLQMSAQVPGLRPAVIGERTRECLEMYRGFRHLVRNVYTFNLRADRVLELASLLRPCREALEKDLEAFLTFLERMDGNQT